MRLASLGAVVSKRRILPTLPHPAAAVERARRHQRLERGASRAGVGVGVLRPGDRARRPWLLGWLGGPVIGIANGIAREATYGRRLDERTARQLSSLAAIAAFAAYFRLLARRWPIGTDREAVEIGAAWFALTVGFEFGFGRAVAKQSWREPPPTTTSPGAAPGRWCSPGSQSAPRWSGV